MNFKLKKILCLDLDGTVRRSKSNPKGFIKSPSDIELLPTIKKIVGYYKKAGYLILGISNQGGVAHGFKTHNQIDLEIAATQELMGGLFDAVKCSYGMEDGNVEPYCYRSLFRKPNVGMLAEFEKEAFKAGFICDWNNSIMVGDRDEDEGLAKNAKIKFYHIDTFLNMPHEFDM